MEDCSIVDRIEIACQVRVDTYTILRSTRENSRTNKCTLRASRMSNVLVLIVVASVVVVVVVFLHVVADVVVRKRGKTMVARNHRGARNADAERRPANSKWLERRRIGRMKGGADGK